MPKGTIDISKKCKPSKPTFRRDRGGRIYWFNNGDQEVWVVFEDGHPFHDDKDPCKGKKKCRIHVPALRYSKGKKVKPQKTKTDECLPFKYRVGVNPIFS